MGLGAKLALGLLVSALLIGGLGMIGQLSGTGFLGHRSWLYGQSELYVLNFQAEGLTLSIDGSEPKPLPFENAQIFELIGGTSSIILRDASGQQVGEHSVQVKGSHAVLKLGPQTCLVALDLGPYYGGGGKGKLVVQQRIMQDQQLYIPQSQNVVWPNKDFPSKFNPSEGPSLWIEKIACELLKPEEEHMMLAYMEGRLQDRMNRFKAKQQPKP